MSTPTATIEPVKYCPSCKTPKPYSAFNSNAAIKSGKEVYCRSCLHIKAQKYRDSHREHLRSKSRQRYAKIREKRIRQRQEAMAASIASGLKTERQCSKCKRFLALNQFKELFTWRNKKYVRGWCRDCRIEYSRTYNRAHKKEARDAHYKRLYGISLQEYQRRYEEQSGLCAICETWQELLYVDHNHKTRKVRGLLCSQCNLMIAQIERDLTLLDKIKRYLSGDAN